MTAISRASSGPLEYRLWFVIHLWIVIPNEVRDLQFAVEENHASSGTLRNNSVSHLILGGAALQRCGKTYPSPRTGRARLQEPALSGAEGCHTAPIKKRASAPEGQGRLPRKSLQRDCHLERSEGPALAPPNCIPPTFFTPPCPNRNLGYWPWSSTFPTVQSSRYSPFAF
jgi:hypothetical protein